MTTGAAERVAQVGATLGEGPAWVGGEQALWFVDIKQHRIHRFDPASGAIDHWDAGNQVGWILPRARGGFLVGLKDGIHSFDPASGAIGPVVAVEPHYPGNRLNDATTDAAGRIWLGTMDDAEEALTGHFHIFEHGALRESGLPPVSITNGPAFSPDGRTLYHTDTLGKIIYAAEVHDDGTLGATRVFAEIEDKAGYPDGPVVDAEGHLWTGLFFGWGVRRYAPDGRLVETVRLPTSNVTKIAFGGPDLRTAYVTTARKGLSEKKLAEQPEAGDLFAFAVDAPGLPLTPVAF